MKVAILAESPADEAALRVLIDGLLGIETQPIELLSLRSRGWPSVRDVLPSIVKQLHYHSDADALVVIADSNHSPLHEPTREPPCGPCRLCSLCLRISETQRGLTPVPTRETLRIAVGVAAPAIEAWYLHGRDAGVTEAAWRVGLDGGSYPYTKLDLKRRVYGADRASIPHMMEKGVAEARRIVRNSALTTMDRVFPSGFAPLATELRRWSAELR